MPMRSEDRTGTTGREGARAPGRRTRWDRVREPAFAWTRSDALLAIGTAANDLIGFSLGATEDGRPSPCPPWSSWSSAGPVYWAAGPDR
ncbi:hypothetical protein GCM10020254_12240 [Streptomyces goshikiensis]